MCQAALAAARDAVLADQSAGRYAVFGYADSGQSNALAVEEEAEQGGLEVGWERGRIILFIIFYFIIFYSLEE